MKTNKTNRVAIALALATSAILTGCGSNSSSAPIVTPGVVGVNGITGGCIPVNQPIVFSATNIAMDNQGDFMMGSIPPTASDAGYYAGQTFGSVGIGTGTGLPTTGYSTYADTQVASSSSPAGEVSGNMVVSPGSALGTGYTSYYNAYSYGMNTSSNSMSGYISISSILQQQINYAAQAESGGYGYNNGYNNIFSGYNYGYNNNYYNYGAGYSTACVSGLAIIGHLYPYQLAGGGFYAQVYLYLNNLSHGYELFWY
jgi:hypothetical protein